MTREEAFKEINDTQDYYINELIKLIDTGADTFKAINFQSPTGTGKTKMMAKLINSLPQYFFIVTTLSKGQLNDQIKTSLEKDCTNKNFSVYGLCDYKTNSKLKASDILGLVPAGMKFIWLRDEGHINTNKWQQLLIDAAFKTINFTATADYADIKCNFTNTMMLRTVSQSTGTPEDAIAKLLEVKADHKHVKGYNPCAIFRCIDDDALYDRIVKACTDAELKYIDLTGNDDYIMADLCRDDNEYDVIINKFKIVEGIDIRRAHVLYMDNQPSNNKTTIQVIGRCRRNALIYRPDVDIWSDTEEAEDLLAATRKCYVFYNVEKMHIDEDESGELCNEFCDKISVENLKANSRIKVINGVLSNGLTLIELAGQTGTFEVLKDEVTGFNVVRPEGEFYANYRSASMNTYLGFTKEELDTMPKVYPTKFNYATGTTEEDKENWSIEISFNEAAFKVTGLAATNRKIELWTTEKSFCARIITGKLIKNYADKLYPIYKDGVETINGAQFFEWDYDHSKVRYFKSDAARAKYLANLPKPRRFKTIKLFSNYICRYEMERIGLHEFTRERFIPAPGTSLVTLDLTNPEVKLTVKKLLSRGAYELSFDTTKYFSYTKQINDRESAIIGTDLMKNIDNKWCEDKAVTSKVRRYSKLNTFISTKYCDKLFEAKSSYFTGKNSFKFDSRANSCLGYCVEYYSKYVVYGKEYLGEYIKKAMDESDFYGVCPGILVRACMLKYKEMMKRAYGSSVSKLIKTIGVGQLVQAKYMEFVNTVVALGTKAADFVKANMPDAVELKKGDLMIDPNLSVRHVSGLADYISHDTIIDIKTTNHIEEAYVKQVLAYHYLSTKRSDLDIKHVIVYDAVSGRSVKIDL